MLSARCKYKIYVIVSCICLSRLVVYSLFITSYSMRLNILNRILCFVDSASLYNLLYKANLVRNLFLVYLSICTCFGRICAHHQEKRLYLCDVWYLLFCVDDCLVCRSICISPAFRRSHFRRQVPVRPQRRERS